MDEDPSAYGAAMLGASAEHCSLPRLAPRGQGRPADGESPGQAFASFLAATDVAIKGRKGELS